MFACVCIYIYITFIIIIDPSTPLSNICLKKKLQLLFISKVYIFYLFEKINKYIYTHTQTYHDYLFFEKINKKILTSHSLRNFGNWIM